MKTRKEILQERRKNSVFKRPDQESIDLLKRIGSYDLDVSRAALLELAKAIETPLREGVMAGEILDGIFEPIKFEPGVYPEFPIDVLKPGTEKDFIAYAIPSHGRLPERAAEGDYIMIPTFEIGNAIDWALRIARDARWDVVGRYIQIFNAGFVKRYNDDGMHVLLGAAAARGILVNDPNAGQGRLTLTLLTKMQQQMTRRAGGNLTSARRGLLSDIYMSLEAFQDMRTWTIAEVDELTRREIFTSQGGGISSIYDIFLHPLIELGVGQEYQNYYTNILGGTMAAGDVEILLGLDLNSNDSFVNPVREELTMHYDETLLRSRKAAVFGWHDHGFGVLDNRRLLLGSL